MTPSSSAPASPACTSCTGCASSACAARVIEAGDGVGGTWYWNRYPGARCDIESLSYSYSFSPELEQEWEWTEKYPTQPELLRYLNHVADRFDLRSDITLQHQGDRGAHYDDGAAGAGRVTTDAGDDADGPVRHHGDRLPVGAEAARDPRPGALPAAAPTTPPAGARTRSGFDGKRVGVIGTGSSGIQSIPIIAEQAADLTVFQRTPNFCMPAGQPPADRRTRSRR